MKRPREHFVPLVPPADAAPRLAARPKKVAQLQADIARAEKEDPLGRRVAALNVILKIQGELLRELEKGKHPADDVKAELARITKQRDEVNGRL